MRDGIHLCPVSRPCPAARGWRAAERRDRSWASSTAGRDPVGVDPDVPVPAPSRIPVQVTRRRAEDAPPGESRRSTRCSLRRTSRAGRETRIRAATSSSTRPAETVATAHGLRSESATKRAVLSAHQEDVAEHGDRARGTSARSDRRRTTSRRRSNRPQFADQRGEQRRQRDRNAVVTAGRCMRRTLRVHLRCAVHRANDPGALPAADADARRPRLPCAA